MSRLYVVSVSKGIWIVFPSVRRYYGRENVWGQVVDHCVDVSCADFGVVPECANSFSLLNKLVAP